MTSYLYDMRRSEIVNSFMSERVYFLEWYKLWEDLSLPGFLEQLSTNAMGTIFEIMFQADGTSKYPKMTLNKI